MSDEGRAQIEAGIRCLLESAGFRASHDFARYWYAETAKIAEAVEDPAARWEILTTALRRIGWDDEGRPRP
jgi:hypothetical protein